MDKEVPVDGLLHLHQISDGYVVVSDRSQLRATWKDARKLPGRGCEVFVSNLPRDILMPKIYDFMVLCGSIYEIRLLMDFSGFNRGMCYVKYFNKDSARMAVLLLNSCQIRPEYKVLLKMSFDNNKLMLVKIPACVTHEQVSQEMASRIGDGLVLITLADQNEDNKATSQCAVLHYETHRQALEARRTLWPGVHLWDSFVLIEWAEPKDLKLARVLYFKNFPEHMTRFELFDFLKCVVNIHTILKMHVQSGMGYIVFSSDKYRKLAKEELDGRYFLGRKLELGFKKYYLPSSSNRKVFQNQLDQRHQENESRHIDKLIGDSQSCFESVVDNWPMFHTRPVYTKPGLYNELEAIEIIIHNLLEKQFPCTIWTVLDAKNKEVFDKSKLLKVLLTVNDIKYTFCFEQISSGLGTAAFCRCSLQHLESY